MHRVICCRYEDLAHDYHLAPLVNWKVSRAQINKLGEAEERIGAVGACAITRPHRSFQRISQVAYSCTGMIWEPGWVVVVSQHKNHQQREQEQEGLHYTFVT